MGNPFYGLPDPVQLSSAINGSDILGSHVGPRMAMVCIRQNGEDENSAHSLLVILKMLEISAANLGRLFSQTTSTILIINIKK